MLDYTKIKKKTLSVKLFDGTTLLLVMPKKKTYEKMVATKSLDVEILDEESINDIYELVAEILSNNTRKIKYTPEEAGDMFDMDDVLILLQEYMSFAGEVENDPN